MAYLEKPQCYWYWFKQFVRMCFHMKKDFYRLGEVLWEAASKLADTLLRSVVRCLREKRLLHRSSKKKSQNTRA